MSAASRLRRLLQFDLRAMLLLVAFCAVLSAWYRDRQRLDHLLNAIQAQRTASSTILSPNFLIHSVPPPASAGETFIESVDGLVGAIRNATDRSQFTNILLQLPLGLMPEDDLIPRLVQLLHDKDEDVRKRGVEALGRIAKRGDIAVPALAHALHDESTDVAAHAAHALSQFGPSAAPAIADLIAIADDDASPNCALAAYSLLSIDPNTAIDERLSAMLRHENSQVRYMAAEAYSHAALTVDRIQPAVPRLIALLNDENPDARSAAARALSRVPATAAIVDALAKALTSETDDDVRFRISRVLFNGDGG